MKKKRIMHGLTEIAGQGYYSVLGLKKMNVDAHMVVYMPNKFGYPYDKSLNIDKSNKKLLPLYILKLLVYFFYSLFRYDIFHFHFGRSFLLNKEVWILKLFRKKILYEFHGSDVRDYKLALKRNKYFPFSGDEENQKKLKKRNRKICKIADGIIIHDYELRAYLPQKQKNVFYVPLRLDIALFAPCYPQLNVEQVTIVHAPSNSDGKGTKYIIDAIDKLKAKYPINFILVQNQTQDKAIEIYKKADIIVDQLYGGTYGVFAIEGMALGKPVITYIMEDVINTFPKELPIQSANIDNIENVLEKLILSPQLRYELGRDGRRYAENYHDYKNIAIYLKRIYDGKQEPVSTRKAFENIKEISLSEGVSNNI